MSELVVKDLRHTYTDGGPQTEVLKGINFKINDGDVIAIST